MFKESLKTEIKELTKKYPEGKQKSALLPALHLVQEQGNNSLSVEQMDTVAGLLNISPIEVYEVATPVVANVIDTNGAGDNYAGAFLYALSQQYSLPECGRLASEVSAQIIQQFGPRLASQDYRDIAQRILSA